MENHCLGCYKIWQSDTRNHFCPKCLKELNSKEFPQTSTLNVIIKSSVNGGKNLSKGHAKLINSRVIDDNGNTLEGDKGVSYMKKHSDTYANRLKALNNLKD